MNSKQKALVLAFFFIFIFVYLFITFVMRPIEIANYIDGLLFSQPLNVYTLTHFIAGMIFGLLYLSFPVFIIVIVSFELFEQTVLVWSSIFHMESALDSILDNIFAIIGYAVGYVIVTRYTKNPKKLTIKGDVIAKTKKKRKIKT